MDYLCSFKKPSYTMIKDFFYYTKAERQGIIILIIIVVVCLGLSFFSHQSKEEEINNNKTFNKEYKDFIQSIEILNRKEYYKYYHPQFEREVVLSPFDPNTVDS